MKMRLGTLLLINYISIAVLNAGDTQSGVYHVATAMVPGSVTEHSFADDVLSNNAFPSVVSQIVSRLQHPALLLVVSEGIAMAYILWGQQNSIPVSMEQTYLASFHKNMLLPLMTGMVSTITKKTSTALISSAAAPVLKPLIVGSSIVGMTTVSFLPGISEDQKAILYAALIAACTPVMQSMYAEAMQRRNRGVRAPMRETRVAKLSDYVVQKQGHIAHLAVALISLTSMVTTVHAYQEGTLSSETQLLAGITLAHAINVARETVLYEYGSRAAQSGISAGSNIVTHIIVEPLVQYGKNLIEGVFNAFGWGVGVL